MAFATFLVPAYKATFLREALDSMLAQTFVDHEIVVLDDDSPEGLESIIQEYDDPRIRYYRNEKNIGGKDLVAQWTACLRYATGSYLILAADDDYYEPEFLQTCVGMAIKYPQVDFIRTGAKQINEQNQLIGIDGILPEFCSKYQYLFYWLQATVFTCMGNMMFKTATLKRKGFINFPCAFGSDTATGIQMAERGVVSSPLMLFSFRISSIHLSSNINLLDKKLEANSQLFEWLRNLRYEEPVHELDQLMYKETTWPMLYTKCRYDYYNLVIKQLPFIKFNVICKCRLLTLNDKWIMFFRFCKDKIFSE